MLIFWSIQVVNAIHGIFNLKEILQHKNYLLIVYNSSNIEDTIVDLLALGQHHQISVECWKPNIVNC